MGRLTIIQIIISGVSTLSDLHVPYDHLPQYSNAYGFMFVRG